MKTIKVEDNSDLVRSVESTAILNINKSELEKHRARRKLLEDKDSKLNEMSSRIESLENMVINLLNIYNKEESERW